MTTHRTGTIETPGRTLLPAVADRLSLLASPTFAGMALLTGVHTAGEPGMLCTGAAASPLAGMAVMYALMCAFHLAPWLRLVAGRRNLGQKP